MRSTGWIFCRYFSIGIHIFSHDWIEVLRLQRIVPEGKCHFHHVISRVHTNNMICHCWCWPCLLVSSSFSGFATVQLLSLCPFYKEMTVHLRNGEFYSITWRIKYLHKLFGTLQHRFSYSLPVYFYQYECIHLYFRW